MLNFVFCFIFIIMLMFFGEMFLHIIFVKFYNIYGYGSYKKFLKQFNKISEWNISIRGSFYGKNSSISSGLLGVVDSIYFNNRYMLILNPIDLIRISIFIKKYKKENKPKRQICKW